MTLLSALVIRINMSISDSCSIDITLHSMYEALILFVKFMPAILKRLAMITAGQEDLLIIFRRQENYTYTPVFKILVKVQKS